MSMQAILTISDAAAEQIKRLMADRTEGTFGVRVGVRTRGCSGMSYTLEYADAQSEYDEIVEDKGVTVLIDPKAVMFVIGTEMDFTSEDLASGFTFNNPNEKGRCGCGESFHV